MMQKELNHLMSLKGTPAFEKKLNELYEKYKNDPGATATIAAFIKEGIQASGERVEAISVKMQLAEITDIVSLAYIARNYFNKTKSWLSQRVNAHVVNGKPAAFTREEIGILNRALQDISKKIGSVSVHRH